LTFLYFYATIYSMERPMQTPEKPRADSQAIDELYQTIEKLFRAKRKAVTTVTSTYGSQEVLEVPRSNGRRARIYRDPSVTIGDTPKLESEDNKSTPNRTFTIELKSKDGGVQHEYTIAHSQQASNGSSVDGYAFDLTGDTASAEFTMSMVIAKELNGEFDDYTSMA
jgi:hypothetical protein